MSVIAQRIVLISAEFPPLPGGVGDYTACLAAALARAGREVHVITTKPAPSKQAEHGTHNTSDDSRITYHVSRSVPDWGWGSWGDVRRALVALRPAVADIQYQTGAYRLHGAINLLPWRLRGLPLTWVTTFHDLREPYLFPKAGPLRRAANLALLRASRAVVVTNPQDEAALPGWARARAVGIPIGANLAAQPPPGWDRFVWRAVHGVPPTACLIAYFGFLNASKGLDVLLVALAALRQDGADYRLLLAGGGTGTSDPTNAATAAALRQQIADLGLTGAVHETGYVDAAEVSAALLSADLAALPFHDGASLRRGSLLAVLAHGLPTVTTRPVQSRSSVLQSLTPWPQLEDGANVRLVPPGDAPALAAALARLGGDAALRAHLVAGALALAGQFTWERIAAQHLALYDRLAAQTQGLGVGG